MKVGKVVVNSIIVIVVVTLIYLGIKAVQAKSGLKTTIAGFKPKLTSSMLLNPASIRAIPTEITANIQNFTNNYYTLQQAMIEVYTPDGILLAEQVIPLSNSVEIRPDNITQFPLQMELVAGEAVKYFTKGISFQDITRFITGGKLGKEIIIKGSIRAEGFTSKLNEKVMV